jgi:hypothetical protein
MLGAGASTPHSSNAITELLRYIQLPTIKTNHTPNFLCRTVQLTHLRHSTP